MNGLLRQNVRPFSALKMLLQEPLRRLSTPCDAASSTYAKTHSIPYPNTPEVKFPRPDQRIIGVEAALLAQREPSFKPTAEIFREFGQEDKVAIVSGANGGLGLEQALALCEAGGKVYGIDLAEVPSVDFKACQLFVEQLANGGKLTYAKASVTDKSSIMAVVDHVKNKEGRLDVCLAVAGINTDEIPCLEFPSDQWDKVFDVNVKGVLFTCQAAASAMLETSCAGSIVVIASMSGSVVNKGHKWIAYNSSKSAVLQMVRSLAAELGSSGIRVNSISPGHMQTKMTIPLMADDPALRAKWNDNPMGRIGLPHEMRGVCAWLASSASSFCTGSDIIVSGGHQIW